MEAVAAEFGHVACFPGVATVQERRRGTMRVADVEVGDQLVGLGGSFSRVATFLHNNADVAEVFLEICYRRTVGGGGHLLVSPQHLVHARLRGRSSRDPSSQAWCDEDRGIDGLLRKPEIAWSWAPAENIRPHDELNDGNNSPLVVESVSRVCLQGVFAPLTATGELLVNGALCSCYAPPSAWMIPHMACHTAMLPVRLLDAARVVVERMSRVKDCKEPPLFSVEALWLLPLMPDTSLHPWASGLLRLATAMQPLQNA
jgi:hypothetical protein